MTKVEKLADDIENLSLGRLLQLCTMAVDSKIDENKIDVLLLSLEIRLQERSLIKRLRTKGEGEK